MEKRPYLDFKDIKARASFLGVLDHYRVEVRKVNQSQFKADCPLPYHTNKDEHGTFGVNVDKGVFKCFSDSCRKAGNGSQGNVIDFVRMMDGSTPYDAAAKLNEWFPNGLTKVANNQNAPRSAERNGGRLGSAKSAEPRPSDNSIPIAPEVNRPLAFTLKDINPAHPMIQSRGITEETARKFGVGYFPGKGSMANRIVFPVHENGALVAYIGRTCGEVTESNPKWKMPTGFVKSMLYGLDRCDPSKPLVVIESPWAVLWLYQKNVQAAALMGCEMTPAQEQTLAPFRTLQLALDNDRAGHEATDKLAKGLQAKHTVLKAYFRE